MRTLLIGRDGQVGRDLEGLLDDPISTDRRGLDLSDELAIRRAMREVEPDVVINAAAYTAVDRAESEKDACFTVNAIAPGILAAEAKRLGALLVHYSTDYVFDGKKKSAYLEDDATNPLSVYGASKLDGEKRIRASGCQHLILRTSWVYSPRGHNFFLTMKKNAGKPLRVVDDQRGAPTSSRFLAENTALLIEKGVQGLFHLVPSGATTWYGFAREILGPEADITPIATADYPAAAQRPANSVLSNAKVRAVLGRELADWRVLLSDVRKSGA